MQTAPTLRLNTVPDSIIAPAFDAPESMLALRAALRTVTLRAMTLRALALGALTLRAMAL